MDSISSKLQNFIRPIQSALPSIRQGRAADGQTTTSRTAQFAEGALLGKTEKIAKGADKVVHVHSGSIPSGDDRASKAYYTPNRAFGMSRKKQLKAEVKIYSTIQGKLQGKGIDISKSKLAIQHKVLEGKARIKGQYTIEVQKAKGAADNVINKDRSFEEVFQLDKDARTGLAELHSIGMVTGDSKLDNTLVYEEEGGALSAKVADFGRACEVDEDQQIVNKGNTRTVDPSGMISKKGEVWSAAVNSLQMYSLLLNDPNSVVEEMKISQGDQEKIPPNQKRKGVERFVLMHKAFSAVENSGTWRGRIENALRRRKPPKTDAGLQSKLMKKYSTTLLTQLEKERKIDTEQKELLQNLFDRSFEPTRDARPTMNETLRMMK